MSRVPKLQTPEDWETFCFGLTECVLHQPTVTDRRHICHHLPTRGMYTVTSVISEDDFSER